MSRINIGVVTGSRAEFGQLLPLLRKMQNDSEINLQLIVTGSHVSGKNKTLPEIESSGIKIFRIIEIKNADDNSRPGIALQISELIKSFTDYFQENRPDLLVIIGDRYEMFAVAIAASNLLIPIAHICGGSTTSGALDEIYRHSITKMSQLHFTTCVEYRNRVIQLGEQPNRVYNVGSLAIENCLKVELLSEKEIKEQIGVKEDRKYCVVTFHPVTMEASGVKKEMEALINALDRFDFDYLITLSNADAGGDEVNRIWEEAQKTHTNFHVMASLGMKRYLSALKYSEMMIGNSSSGTTEGPSMKIPSIDIGDRQKGRYFCESLIHCNANEDEIVAAINKALTPEFQEIIKHINNPFGDGNTSQLIVNIIKENINSIEMKKIFYDIKTGDRI